jgi:hypothetical protein
MSADNGIYILETKGPEYRVIHAQNIEEVYGNFSDDSFRWQGDPEVMLEYFSNAPVFTDEKKALDYAIELSHNYEYLEYGICQVTEFKDWDFNRLKERYGKEGEGSSR